MRRGVGPPPRLWPPSWRRVRRSRAAGPPRTSPIRGASPCCTSRTTRRGGELGYLASGLTGELIDALSQVPALEVVSRNAVKPYRDGVVSLDSLVAELQVGSVVEGSVQRSGDSVRVRVELVDAAPPLAPGKPHPRAAAGRRARPGARRGREVGALSAAAAGAGGAPAAGGGGRRAAAPALALVLRAEQAARDALRLGAGPPAGRASARGCWARPTRCCARRRRRTRRGRGPQLLRGQVALAACHGAPAPDRPRLLRGRPAHADRVLAREPASAPALELRGAARWRLGMEAGAGGTAVLEAAERDLRAAVEADASLAGAWGTLARLLLARGRLAESDLAAGRALARTPTWRTPPASCSACTSAP